MHPSRTVSTTGPCAPEHFGPVNYSCAMPRTPRTSSRAEDSKDDGTDYRPRDFGRITWLLKLAEREVGRELDRELAHTGLTKSQFGVLQALMHLERASSAALARTVFVTPQAMVGIVAGLERKGFIRRKSSKLSGRAIDATVTATGKTAFNAAERRVRYVDDLLAKEFTPPELDQFYDFLDRAIATMRRPGPGSAEDAVTDGSVQRNTAKHLLELNT